MMKTSPLLLAVTVLLTIFPSSCRQTPADDTPSAVDTVSPPDSMIYGLTCDGTTDSVLVFLPFTRGADPVSYNIVTARATGKVIGRPSLGDWVGIILNPNDTTEATMVVNLDQLKGTWTYPVRPSWKDKSKLSPRAMRQKLAELPDSLKEAYMVPREYGFTLKRSSVASPVGFVRNKSSLHDDSPVEYPEVKRYTNWICRNGQLILTSVRDTADNRPAQHNTRNMPATYDTLSFVFLSDDSLILRRQDRRQIHMHRKQSAELANLKAQKAADIIQSGTKSKK